MLPGEPPPDTDEYDLALSQSPVSDTSAMGAIFGDVQLTPKALGAMAGLAHDNPSSAAAYAGGEAYDAGQLRAMGIDLSSPAKLTADEANKRFGIDGRLAFTAPVGEGEAAFKHNETQKRIWRDEVLSRADINPLQSLGAGLAGGLLDPVGLPLILAPEALGVRGGVEGAMAGRGYFAAGEAVVKSGRLANIGRGFVAGGAEGLAGGALYEAPNYGLRHYAGEDDYTLGDSLANVALGGVLGAGFGAFGGALRRGGAAGERLPASVEAHDVDTRMGAAMTALDTAAEDGPIRVGSLLEAQEARMRPTSAALSALDEGDTAITINARLLDEAVAVTTRGEEVPVRYALVEARDLVTSHTDDLERNPDFPPELQPRSRERAGAQAKNHALEAELNPKRLMRETGAESGAPMISPDGVVESGNGRSIALRRSAATGTPAYERYKTELAAQGFDVGGFDQPVLVRVRQKAMTGEDRARLARDMNADVTERMSAAEQAMADAQGIDDALLETLTNSDAGGRRGFARGFIGRIGGDQANSLIAADGTLSSAGSQRVEAALVAKAYGDPRLVEALFEASDPNIKVLGRALTDAAPGWARMRAMAGRGDIPADLDVTESLRAAVDLVRWARDSNLKVWEVIADRLGQADMFGGQAISPQAEAFLRLFFRDEEFRFQRAGDKIAIGLSEYARRASEATPGPDLFGDVANAGTARQILEDLAGRFTRAEADHPAGPDVASLFDVGEPREQLGPIDLRPQGGEGPGRPGVAEPAAPKEAGKADGAQSDVPSPSRAGAVIAADDELRALAADTESLIAESGLELRAFGKATDPDTIEKAVRAAAICLGEGME